ncbi:MAG: hypothetical protein LBQ37_02655 [Elusimicrobiota bacterium]|jgi:hypothetical protein|nr:hypothetical protein [Elusimicrobiota bacterium]
MSEGDTNSNNEIEGSENITGDTCNEIEGSENSIGNTYIQLIIIAASVDEPTLSILEKIIRNFGKNNNQKEDE